VRLTGYNVAAVHVVSDTPTVWLRDRSAPAATLSSDVGIAVSLGETLAVLQRGTTIPATNSCIVTTSEDYQMDMHVQVFYGDYCQTEKNTLIGETVLTRISPRKKGEVELELELSVDVQGSVTLRAKDITSKKPWKDYTFRRRIRK